MNGRGSSPLAPNIIFDLPGNNLGDGGEVVSTDVLNNGSNRTLNNHVRFRLQVRNTSNTPFIMEADTSLGLSCTNCASTVTIPFSKLSWTVGTSTETQDAQPAPGRFNNATQTWVNGALPSNNTFNLQFNFLNDEVLPAGIYQGQFLTRGIPD